MQLNSADDGIEVILETPVAQQLQVLPRTDAPSGLRQGNTYIADIPNAQLRLPSGNTFRRNNPVAGITSVTVTNSAPNSIRVTVTGSEGVPKVELFDSDEGLIFSFIPTASPANQSPQTPEHLNKLNLKTRHSQRRRHLVMQHLNKPSLEGKHSQMQRH